MAPISRTQHSHRCLPYRLTPLRKTLWNISAHLPMQLTDKKELQFSQLTVLKSMMLTLHKTIQAEFRYSVSHVRKIIDQVEERTDQIERQVEEVTYVS